VSEWSSTSIHRDFVKIILQSTVLIHAGKLKNKTNIEEFHFHASLDFMTSCTNYFSRLIADVVKVYE
jgi:hypothetical protein